MLAFMRPSRIALSFTALLLLACSPEERDFSTEASSGAGGGDGGAGGAGGGQVACMPGEMVMCYSGPEGTQDVGLCKPGVQTCRPDQTGFGPCEGEVLPTAESCADPADEDCDAAPACGDALWSKAFGDPTSQRPTAIATDKDGNVIVVGAFDGKVDFGKDVHASAGSEDIFVLKLAPDGSTLWSRRFGDTLGDVALSVAATPDGDIVVGGSFQGTVDFGNGPLTSAGLSDMFLLKLGSGGVTLWSKRFGDSASQSIGAVTVDPAGHVVIAGGFIGSVNFSAFAPLTSAGLADVFVAKFGPSGAFIWAKSFGDASSQGAMSVATDATGNIVVAGTNTGTFDFGGPPIATAGSSDIFVAKLEAGGGGHIWSKGFGDPSLQALFGAGVDAQGNVAFGGRYGGSMDLGGGALEPAGSGENFFVAKLGPAGDHVFSRGFATDFTKHAGGVGVDAVGNVLLTGHLNGPADLGFGPVVPKAPFDAFALKVDAAGSPVWARVFGADASQQGRAIAAGPKGNVYVTGTNEGVIDFGLGPLTTAGSADIFLAKLAP
jgi:hypothetical protein